MITADPVDLLLKRSLLSVLRRFLLFVQDSAQSTALQGTGNSGATGWGRIEIICDFRKEEPTFCQQSGDPVIG
jgi:hypothetical protein